MKLYISFLDINACVNVTTHKCDAKANCNNNEGSYNCSCNTGYEGNGFMCTGE